MGLKVVLFETEVFLPISGSYFFPDLNIPIFQIQ